MDEIKADKLMYITKDVAQNYPFWGLKLVFETFKRMFL